ncbi:MAG: hypothetical protein KME28_11335 [Pelatocladus maniniholoensis HA4357-MV3]|jgi:germacradienol/geosmin synthase|uniref:Uncharacterized protein n=1 Tax=Pelatocladus maniniholoensis HA4357-MV3 TaxID=1117104 RepID=A0A9E3LT78_9NOST|nr:hypothetical protein [Pelatocladus maniniholoensis HA4357-MV3]BAZ68410.1 terpene synthase metal-binding domain-containing protein [Fischerella sp. NIES-4106]
MTLSKQPFELPSCYVPWLARLNPNLEAARVHSKAWAYEMGILGGAEGSEDYDYGIWDERLRSPPLNQCVSSKTL